MLHILRAALLASSMLLASNAAHAADLRVSPAPGAAPETVYDHRSQACEAWDVPDAPARAWKGADGTVHLLAAHTNARTLSGPSLDRLRHDCRVVFKSGKRDDPARYDDVGWLTSPYTLDGTTVYGLVHNEYHGHKRRNLCPAGDYMACWWNALTLTVSKDGGQSFGPGRYVAGIPYKFRGDLGRRAGLFAPSNIVERQGWYYAMAFAEGIGEQKRGVCLMRTRDLGDPKSWRAWDGRDFTVRFADPYAEGEADAAAHACAPLPPGRLPFTVTSLVRHSGTGLWVAVMAGRRAERPGAQPVSGVWTSTSPDLVTWSPPRLALAAPLLTDKACGVAESYYYPAILDPNAKTRNFEDVGNNAYLYMTRLAQNGCKPTQDRDLVRIMIRLEPITGG
ncbi:hypothetical protein [Azospirillum rugosum]|uniref:DUF4185 domain-containing protein n=1 Tax=Azospirillum rugosum TaxID=416170 RepID=A0ABS4SGS7_9PROT|nr:hypothetical protein [Azospirillum rugosum]MBP2291394.1 hypothetical protein [Azospirillum rugosum]MDQ0525182.1 hypothetical protein [Azospirillum rugosum]